MFNRIGIIFNLIIISCIPFQGSTPDWIVNRPISENSWYGIGSSLESEENYREIARTHAVNEIASQISTSIKSSLKTVRTEDNLNYQQYSEFIIESRVELSLPSVEIIKSYSKDGKYFILTELIKADYFREIELKKQKAISTAIDYMTKAVETLSFESFKYLSTAIIEIKPFIDLPLITEFPKGSKNKVNIFSKILILAEEMSNRLVLTCDRQEIQTTIGLKRTLVFNISFTDKATNQPITNFPLKGEMGANLITESAFSDQNGDAKFNLFKVIDKTPIQYLEIYPDLSKFSDDLILLTPASVKIKVNARSPIIYLQITEKNLDKNIDSPFIMPVIKELFVQTYSAEFTNDQSLSDFKVVASFTTKAKLININEYGLFQAYADGTISIYDTFSETEIYQKSINNVRGVDFQTLEGAGRNALEKMVKKINNESFQEIISNLDDYSSNKQGRN
ncbi:MAG: LPP20 family lipoprotein [Candidatus Marinimicrobia bacterium]|nr:LPP20 family lipoprotein [Candidatus Neomarinimicrobiota bacterium]